MARWRIGGKAIACCRITASFGELIRKGREPRYLYIPALADQGLVGDLDVRMTVEKSVVARWVRAPGWGTDEDGRKLTRSIVRKTGRFAFPNDIVRMLRYLENRIKDKHGKSSLEGSLLTEIDEIRLIASPSWESEELKLMFLLVFPESVDKTSAQLARQIEEWRSMIGTNPRVTSIEFSMEKLSTMTAQRYLEADPMDFDHLSANSVTP